MRNFYNTTKGQVISMWVFGIVSLLVGGSHGEYELDFLSASLGIAVPFFVVFYTLGWRNNKKG